MYVEHEAVLGLGENLFRLSICLVCPQGGMCPSLTVQRYVL